jgi:hypothetical protein
MYTKKEILKATKLLMLDNTIKYPSCLEEEIKIKNRILNLIEQTKFNSKH